MDFEKEARELRAQIEKVSRRQSVVCDSELPLISQVLRRAFIAGQIDMRERAVEKFESQAKPNFDTYVTAAVSGTYENVVNRIRSLPTLDNPTPPQSGK